MYNTKAFYRGSALVPFSVSSSSCVHEQLLPSAVRSYNKSDYLVTAYLAIALASVLDARHFEGGRLHHDV